MRRGLMRCEEVWGDVRRWKEDVQRDLRRRKEVKGDVRL